MSRVSDGFSGIGQNAERRSLRSKWILRDTGLCSDESLRSKGLNEEGWV